MAKVLVMPIDPQEPVARSWLTVLTAAESERAGRYRHPTDAYRFVAGRALLRNVLSSRLGTRTRDVILVEAADGRVVLADLPRPGLFFSVSHSGSLVVVAVAECAIGVDVQPVPDLPLTPLLIARTCTRRESDVLEPLGADDRRREFARLWARKEAFCKAGGAAGMAHAGSIDVLDRRKRGRTPWRLYDLEIAGHAGYAAAVAVGGRARILTIRVDPSF